MSFIQIWVLLLIYKKAYKGQRGKDYVLVMLALSFAAKELAFIQCFNDAWMAFFMVLFVFCQQRHYMYLAALCFACSLSIKMSALLMVPGLLLTSVFAYGIPRTLL
jgi:uncharacterized membrane protein